MKVLKSVITIIICIVIFLKQGGSQSLPPFNLEVTATPSTCLQNGSLTFTTTSTQINAAITFTITQLSNDTILASNISNTSWSGIVPGYYKVDATQTLDNQSSIASDTAYVSNLFTPLTFTNIIKNEICGNDGGIMLNISGGEFASVAVTNGSTVSFTQDSTNIVNLSAGSYTIEVMDTCGNVKTVSVEVLNTPASITVDQNYNQYKYDLECDQTRYRTGFYPLPGGILKYPLTVDVTVHAPVSAVLGDTIITSVIPNGYILGLVNYSDTIPFYGNGIPYNIDFFVTDGCGNTATNSATINESLFTQTTPLSINCNLGFQQIVNRSYDPIMIEFLEVPVGFDPYVINTNHPGPFNTSFPINYIDSINGIPSGMYKMKIKDACDSITHMVTISKPSLNAANAYVATGCEDGYGGFILISNGNIDTAIIQSGPHAFSNVYPVNVSQYIDDIPLNGTLRLGGLPDGEYEIDIKDSCGDTLRRTVNVVGFVDSSFNYKVIPSCGKFDLYINHSTNYFSESYVAAQPEPLYFLQHYDSSDMRWEFMNDVEYISGTNYGNTYPTLTNKDTTFNIFSSGKFRVLRLTNVTNNGGTINSNNPNALVAYELCEDILVEFSYANDGFQFDSLYSSFCNDTISAVESYTLYGSAQGVAPITFKILEKNNASFILDNGTDSIFTNIEAGIYKIMAADGCGNEFIREIETSNIFQPTIQTDSICDGSVGRLFTQNFPFLNYVWKKEGLFDTLSTSNQLIFDPFVSTINQGTYTLHLTSNVDSFCFNQVLSFTITNDTSNINSGNDLEQMICDNLTQVNLSSYLSGNANSNGQWFFNNSAVYVDQISEYPTSNLSYGDNLFQYVVSGYCELSDTAIINLQLDSCMVPCVEITGKLKLNTPIGGQPGFKLLVFNPDSTIGIVDPAILGVNFNSLQQTQLNQTYQNLNQHELLTQIMEERKILLDKLKQQEEKIQKLSAIINGQ